MGYQGLHTHRIEAIEEGWMWGQTIFRAASASVSAVCSCGLSTVDGSIAYDIGLEQYVAGSVPKHLEC